AAGALAGSSNSADGSPGFTNRDANFASRAAQPDTAISAVTAARRAALEKRVHLAIGSLVHFGVRARAFVTSRHTSALPFHSSSRPSRARRRIRYRTRNTPARMMRIMFVFIRLHLLALSEPCQPHPV